MKYLLICISMFLLSSCGDESEIKSESEKTTYADDTFIFGHFYGECLGETCIEIFKIENGKLYEDLNDVYPNGTDENFEWELLDDEKFKLVEMFPSQFPVELIDETDQVLGAPDAGDWGGFIIGKINDGNLRIWLIDTMDDNLPEYLHEYNDSIGEIINML